MSTASGDMIVKAEYDAVVVGSAAARPRVQAKRVLPQPFLREISHSELSGPRAGIPMLARGSNLR
jgi:hypothetical protein